MYYWSWIFNVRKVPKVWKHSDTLLFSTPCLHEVGPKQNNHFFSDTSTAVWLLGAAAVPDFTLAFPHGTARPSNVAVPFQYNRSFAARSRTYPGGTHGAARPNVPSVRRGPERSLTNFTGPSSAIFPLSGLPNSRRASSHGEPRSLRFPQPRRAREGAEQRSGGHAHGEAHHEAHLHSVEAAGLRLPVRAHGHGHLRRSAPRSAPRTAPLADLIGADPREIIFTSGATESNNMAIKGVARFYKSRKKHIITTQTEHKCVLDSCRSLEAEGFQITYLPVQKNGLIDLKELEAAFQPDTSLVSVMAVNNEIGVKQPIRDIGEICRARKVFFHTDAAQAVGKIPVDVNDLKIDLMSISGHKIYGPKGVGAIYVRRRPRVRLEPLQSGGGQERGLRSGTVPTPLAVGLGAACEVAQEEMEYDHKRISQLAERLVTKIMSEVPDVVMNGDREHRYPGCINLSFAYVEGESLLMALKDVALSSGSLFLSSTCTLFQLVMFFLCFRFGIGRFTTEEEVDYTVQKCIQHVKRLREMSPLWEMVQDGIDLKSIKWSQH
uniref:cysteine desulfurase n=1 Tax=Chrysolophus pictus TaxID=9089 RepID=A0A8C3LM36_CHRPC